MSREVIDSALVQQFKDYLKNKDKNYDALNTTEMENESKNFLNDVYHCAPKVSLKNKDFGFFSPSLNR